RYPRSSLPRTLYTAPKISTSVLPLGMASTSAALRPNQATSCVMPAVWPRPDYTTALSHRRRTGSGGILSAGVSLYSILRTLLFGCDPERAHGLAVAALRLTQAVPG